MKIFPTGPFNLSLTVTLKLQRVVSKKGWFIARYTLKTTDPSFVVERFLPLRQLHPIWYEPLPGHSAGMEWLRGDEPDLLVRLRLAEAKHLRIAVCGTEFKDRWPAVLSENTIKALAFGYLRRMGV